jgi:hypothetical protein
MSNKDSPQGFKQYRIKCAKRTLTSISQIFELSFHNSSCSPKQGCWVMGDNRLIS